MHELCNDSLRPVKNIRLLRKGFQGLFLLIVFLRYHRAANDFLVVLPLLAFIAGNFFCGWFCPLGTLQEILGKIGSLFVRKKLRLPVRFQRYAQFSKYILMLAILLFAALGIMRMEDANALPLDAYQSFFAVFDGNPLTTLAAAFLIVMLALALFVDRPFCNYLCVNSIEYAVPSCTRIFTVKRDPSVCIECGACDRACPMNIRVSKAVELRNLQCINCFECINACPARGALGYGWAKIAIRSIRDKIKRTR